MSVFSRLSDLVAANVNALLDRAEDPELLLAQVVREMEDGLARARRYAAAAIATERELRRELDHHRAQSERWKARAREALAGGREDLARRALERKQEHDALVAGLEPQHAEAVQTGQAARTALRALEARLAEARRKQRALQARHRTARVRVEVHRHLGAGLDASGAAEARFGRLEYRLTRRVDELTAEADLLDLAGIEAEFTDLERRQAIDRELDELKRSGP